MDGNSIHTRANGTRKPMTTRNDLPSDLAALVQRPPIYRLLGVGEKVYGDHLNHVWKGLAGVPGLDEPGIPVFAK